MKISALIYCVYVRDFVAKLWHAESTASIFCDFTCAPYSHLQSFDHLGYGKLSVRINECSGDGGRLSPKKTSFVKKKCCS